MLDARRSFNVKRAGETERESVCTGFVRVLRASGGSARGQFIGKNGAFIRRLKKMTDCFAVYNALCMHVGIYMCE